MRRLGGFLRQVADRVDLAGAPRRTSWSFTFEDSVGVVFNQDGKGCPLWHYGEADYQRAYDEAQWTGVDLEKPEWVTVGYRVAGTADGEEVLVLGSADITDASLGRQVRGHDELPPDQAAMVPRFIKPRAAKIPRWAVLLKCEMRTFVQVTGADYSAALKEMFSRGGRSG